MGDLPEDVSTLPDGARSLEVECTPDDALRAALGGPKFLHPFRPGYRWRPYRGEWYEPPGSNDPPELMRPRRELLPPG